MSVMATTSPALRARRTWNIDQWGSGYFDVDDHGQAWYARWVMMQKVQRYR